VTKAILGAIIFFYQHIYGNIFFSGGVTQ